MDREVNLLYPLDQFYALASLPLPAVLQVAGEVVPEPNRQLLVGNHDMTPTLEAFHGEAIHIRVIEKQQDEETYARLVVLLLEHSTKPVEFGAIIIHLSLFPPEARERILEGQCPLGTILAIYDIAHVSRPQAFLQFESDALIEETLCLNSPGRLYGRRNVLLTPQNEILADIVEILPP